MPIRPLATLYTCPACGWSKTIKPRSDALMPGDMPSDCPVCGHVPLEHRPAPRLPTQPLLENLAQQIKSLLR
mgnify:CR=1 FL=1